jgi:hypothetical protein
MLHQRAIACSTCACLLLVAAQTTRHLVKRKVAEAKRPGISDLKYKELTGQIDRLHLMSIAFSAVSLTPLLLISRVLALGRHYLLEQLGITALVGAAFWLSKHIELKWLKPWFTDPLTLARSATLALIGLIVVCSVYLLVSDPKASKQAIQEQWTKMAGGVHD